MALSLLAASTQFIQHLHETGKANATIIAYSKDIEQLVEFLAAKGVLEVNAVTPEQIEEFKEQLRRNRYSSKSISRKINSFKAFFRFLISSNELTANPAEEILHPRVDVVPPRVLSKLEYRALRDAARSDVRLSAIVELLLQTGMRISELANLQVADVDFERNVITIQPQDSRPSRRVPMNAAAKQAITEYLQLRPRSREKTLFLTKTCRPFLVRNIRTAIDRYFRIAGVKDAKVNDLRHTFIVEQLKAGTPLVYVSQLVGHKRITTTEKYQKLITVSPDNNQPIIKIEEL